MKWIVAVFLLVVLSVVALLVTMSVEPDTPAPGPGARGVPQDDGAGGGAALTRGADGGAAGAGGGAGERAGAQRYTNPGDGPHVVPASLTGDLEVRVLLKTTRTTMPDADVWLFDRDSRPAQEWQAAFGTNEERERYIKAHGTRYRTDRQGIAFVPRVETGAILARAEGHGGMKEWIGLVPSPFEILLDADIDLRVLVVDGSGLPVGNVPVAICLDDAALPYSLIIRPTVHPIGIATFSRLAATLQSRADGKGYAVTLGIPCRSRQLVPIDPRSLPGAPVKLVLPPVGTVRVRAVDGDGQRISENMIIALGREVQDERTGSMVFRAETTRRAGSGEAYFPIVEVGAPLTIQFSGIARLRDMVVQRSGPARAGEEVVYDVQWNTAQPAIVGRAVARDGEVLANRRGRFRLWSRGRAAGGPPLVTDAEGRFRMVLTSPWELGSERQAILELWPSDGQGAPYEATLDLSYEATPGDTEYGDVVFDAKPVLAAGIVIGAGAPVASAHVRAEHYVLKKGKGGEEEGEWTPVTDVSATTQPDGTFVVYGTVDAGPLRLVVRRRGFAEALVEGLQPGATGLRVLLVEGPLETRDGAKERDLEASGLDDGSGKDQ
jgi:hypothetical protein